MRKPVGRTRCGPSFDLRLRARKHCLRYLEADPPGFAQVDRYVQVGAGRDGNVAGFAPLEYVGNHPAGYRAELVVVEAAANQNSAGHVAGVAYRRYPSL